MRLLATLGTGRYEECDYHLSGAPEATWRSRFSPVATARLVEGITEVTLLATDEAWATHGASIERELREAGVATARLDVAHARDHAGLESFFDCIFEAAHGVTEVRLDLTHSFRHHPFLMYASATFLQTLRGVSIRGVHYAMYQAEPGVATPRVPIIDLGFLLTIAETHHAVRQFRETGDARRVAGMLGEFKDDKGRRGEGNPTLSKLAGSVAALGSALSTSLPLEAGLAARHLAGLVDEALPGLPSTLRAAVEPLGEIAQRLACSSATNKRGKEGIQLDLPELDRQLRHVEFLLEAERLDDALLALSEWLVNRVLLAGGDVEGWLSRAVREPNEKRMNAARPDRGDTVERSAPERELLALWSKVRDWRNDLAHCGFREESRRLDRRAVEDLLGRCRARLDDDSFWRLRDGPAEAAES